MQQKLSPVSIRVPLLGFEKADNGGDTDYTFTDVTCPFCVILTDETHV